MATIALLSSGNVARALAGELRDAGHEVIVGSRDPQKTAPGRAGEIGISVTDLQAAAGESGWPSDGVRPRRRHRRPAAEAFVLMVASLVRAPGPVPFAMSTAR